MIDLQSWEAWFVTGSQHLYGEEVLTQVGDHAAKVSQALSEAAEIPVRIVCKPVVTTPDAIHDLFRDANQASECVGVVAWMHTFSPAKMWIGGLRAARKPLVHLHTQFNQEIPWNTIDMDFMNLNQSAHGGREFGFMCSRLRLPRTVVVGHWEDPRVRRQLAVWARSAAARHDAQSLRIARLGDNMREVAVTEGDKVEAQIRLGYAVNGYGLGDLVCHVDAVTDADVRDLVAEYEVEYDVADSLRKGGQQRSALQDAARIELGLRQFLVECHAGAFTDTFENLHGLKQLPGIAVQRLMADGYGFGAEGDWKTAALVRAMKVMSLGLGGGTSFMEDYTYHLAPTGGQVLGAHMLEICPSIAAGQPSLEIHPLSIGGKEEPVRLVFDTPPGDALNAAVVELGGRFRLLVNDVKVVSPPEQLPRLPVARALWEPRPDLSTAAAAWILAGGPHHTSFTQALTADYLESFAEMSHVEFLHIGDRTTLADFKNHLRWNQAYWHLAGGC